MLCDTIISHIVEEVIINDKLGVVIMGAECSKWRLIEHSPETIRFSEKLR